jgi:hypothetical protein
MPVGARATPGKPTTTRLCKYRNSVCLYQSQGTLGVHKSAEKLKYTLSLLADLDRLFQEFPDQQALVQKHIQSQVRCLT